MPYIGNSPGTGTRNRFIFTATASQTTFSGADDNGKTLAYSDGDYVDVYLNGICLVPVDDYAATSKTSIVLTVGAAASDTLEVVAYDIATIADTVSKANGGQFDGDVTVEADFTVDTNTLHVDSTNNRVGIGTGSPNAPAAILANTTTYEGLELVTPTGDSSGEFHIGVHQNGSTAGRSIVFNRGGSDGMDTESMRIDQYGNLLVGTTSTLVWNGAVSKKTIFGGDSGNTVISMHSDSTSTNQGAILEGLSTSTTSFSKALGSIAFLRENTSTTNLNSYTAFYTNYAGTSYERMRINAVGEVFINSTSNPSSGRLVIDYARGSSAGLRIKDTVGSGGTGVIADFYNSSNSSVGSITHNSSSTSFNTTSDYRLKENVTDVTDGITRVKQLAPKRFNWIADPDTTVDGFLAHEAAVAVPEAVTGTKDAMRDEEYVVTAELGEIYTPATDDADEIIHSTDVFEPETLEEGQLWRATTEAVMGTRSVPDYQGIDQSKLVPLLTAALQEAIAKIETLETRVAALEAN